MKCKICPEECLIENSHIFNFNGLCGVYDKINDENCLLISCIAVEPIEKKPFQNYLKNTKTLSVGFFGCNLNCSFCENFEITQNFSLDENKKIELTDIIDLAKKYDCQSISLTYTEPTIWYHQIVKLGLLLKDTDIKLILKTNAYISRPIWEKICEVVDAINIDWKGNYNFKNITGASQYIIEDRIKYAHKKNIYIEISLPLYYRKMKDLREEMHYFGNFMYGIDKNMICHLLKISPSYKYEDVALPDGEFVQKEAKNILSNYLNSNNLYFV